MKKILMLLALPLCLAYPAAAENASAIITLNGVEFGSHLSYTSLAKDYKNDDFDGFSAGLNAGLLFYPISIGAEFQTMGALEAHGTTYVHYYQYGPYIKLMFNPKKAISPQKASPIQAELFAKLGGGTFEAAYKESLPDEKARNINFGLGMDLRDKTNTWATGFEYRMHTIKPKGDDRYHIFAHVVSITASLRFGAKKVAAGNYSYTVPTEKPMQAPANYGGTYNASVNTYTPVIVNAGSKKIRQIPSLAEEPAQMLNRIYGKNGSWFGK